MSFGTGPFGSSLGFTIPSPDPENHSPLRSSRRIDGRTRRYVIDEFGGFEGMNDTAQRVLLLVSFEVKKTPLLTDRSLEETKQNIITALKPLTSGPEPYINQLNVSVSHDKKETSYISVSFFDLRRNEQSGVQV